MLTNTRMTTVYHSVTERPAGSAGTELPRCVARQRVCPPAAVQQALPSEIVARPECRRPIGRDDKYAHCAPIRLCLSQSKAPLTFILSVILAEMRLTQASLDRQIIGKAHLKLQFYHQYDRYRQCFTIVIPVVQRCSGWADVPHGVLQAACIRGWVDQHPGGMPRGRFAADGPHMCRGLHCRIQVCARPRICPVLSAASDGRGRRNGHILTRNRPRYCLERRKDN